MDQTTDRRSRREIRYARSGDAFRDIRYMTGLTATDTALIDALGEHRLTELNTRGARLEYAEALTYLRAEADRALAD